MWEKFCSGDDKQYPVTYYICILMFVVLFCRFFLKLLTLFCCFCLLQIGGIDGLT